MIISASRETVTTITVEVAFAESKVQHVVAVELAKPATVGDALAAVAMLPEFAGAGLAEGPVGVFGRVVSRDHRLSNWDRVELYRPLRQEPTAARRERAQRQRDAR